MDKNSFENYEKIISEEFENSTIFNSSEDSQKKAKKHIKNSYVKLLCVLLCLVIIIGSGIFSVVKFWPAEEQVEETTSSNEAQIDLTSSANVSLEDMKNVSKNAVSNVSKIVIKNETDKYVCVPYKVTETDSEGEETETVYFKLQGIDKEIPIDESYVTAFYDSVFEVSAISKLENKWTTEDCGLDNPKILVEVTMADNSVFDIKVGDKLATNDGYYYVSTSLKNGIYIADGSVYENFSAEFNSLVDLTMFEAITENDDNSEYFLNNQLAVFDSIEINGDNFSSAKLSYKSSDDEVMSYFIENPVKTYADEEKIATLLSPLSSGFTASSVYKVQPKASDITEYGLNQPYLEVNYNLNNRVYNIKFSKPGIKDNNYCACVVDDIPVVFAVLAENVEFIDWKLDDLRYSLLYLKNIETFKAYTVKYNGKEYKYELSFDVVESDSDTDETTSAEEKVLSVVLNSSPIDSDNFKTAYQRLTMASATKYVGKNVELNKNPDVAFEIELKNGSTDIITYTKYNENYYLHKLNGIGDELIPTRTVESLILNYEKLRKGEEVISPNNQQ